MSSNFKSGSNDISDGRKPLQRMFSRVPRHYDLLNRLLTFRLDEHWRNRAVRRILSEDPLRVMDLGTGTGDMAVRLARKRPDMEVVGYDFSAPMLEVARRKASRYRLNNVQFVEGDAAAMPFEEASFDLVGISFAFRNITFKNPHTRYYLNETLRILKPQGRFVIVETSQPRSPLMRYLFHQYFKLVVSGVGGYISGAKGAYHYLAYSARHFYTREGLTDLLLRHGFIDIRHQRLFFGVAAITTATKP